MGNGGFWAARLTSRHLEKVGVGGWDAHDCLGRTRGRYCALIAVDAAVVAYLQEQRSVAESRTPERALRAACTRRLVHVNFVIGILYRTASYGVVWTATVLGRRNIAGALVAQQSEAKAAVAAEAVSMDALNCGGRNHAFRGAQSALYTARRIDLPYHVRAGPSTARRWQRAIGQIRATIAQAIAVACRALLL